MHEYNAHSRRGAAGGPQAPPPPPSRTKWTRLVHPSVLIGHVSRVLRPCSPRGGRSAARLQHAPLQSARDIQWLKFPECTRRRGHGRRGRRACSACTAARVLSKWRVGTMSAAVNAVCAAGGARVRAHRTGAEADVAAAESRGGRGSTAGQRGGLAAPGPALRSFMLSGGCGVIPHVTTFRSRSHTSALAFGSRSLCETSPPPRAPLAPPCDSRTERSVEWRAPRAVPRSLRCGTRSRRCSTSAGCPAPVTAAAWAPTPRPLRPVAPPHDANESLPLSPAPSDAAARA